MADWQVGDLALCLRIEPWVLLGGGLWAAGPKAGQVFAVTAIRRDADGKVGLKFSAFQKRGYRWFNIIYFRKITPGADIEGFEEPRRIPVKEKA